MDKITIHFINLYERVKNNNKHLLNKQKFRNLAIPLFQAASFPKMEACMWATCRYTHAFMPCHEPI